MNFRTTISALGVRLRSPRTLLAIVVSCVATAAVGGPLALEAYNARDLIAAERAGAETTDDGSRSGDRGSSDQPVDATSSTTSPTSTTLGSIGIPTTTGDGTGDGGGTGTGGGETGGGGTSTSTPATTTPGVDGSSVTTAPPTITPPGPTTTIPAGLLTILVSVSAQHVPFAPLAGNQVTGTVYVFIADVAIGLVTWRLDGEDVRLPDGRLDTRSLPTGAHSLQALVVTPLGTLTGGATFTVAR